MQKTKVPLFRPREKSPTPNPLDVLAGELKYFVERDLEGPPASVVNEDIADVFRFMIYSMLEAYSRGKEFRTGVQPEQLQIVYHAGFEMLCRLLAYRSRIVNAVQLVSSNFRGEILTLIESFGLNEEQCKAAKDSFRNFEENFESTLMDVLDSISRQQLGID